MGVFASMIVASLGRLAPLAEIDGRKNDCQGLCSGSAMVL